MKHPELTVVVTAYNEAANLATLHRRLVATLHGLHALQWQILYVDDGSSDLTWHVIETLASQESRVSGIRLSRNFGKEIALSAGLDAVQNGALVFIDADGQDPPELIPVFVARWRMGYDNV